MKGKEGEGVLNQPLPKLSSKSRKVKKSIWSVEQLLEANSSCMPPRDQSALGAVGRQRQPYMTMTGTLTLNPFIIRAGRAICGGQAERADLIHHTET